MRAGVFDSGLGGLTVVKSLAEKKCFHEIVYFGDTARVPYGTKDKDTIVRYSEDALNILAPFEIDVLIVGCNSASSVALPALEKKSPVPVIGVIEPGVEAAIASGIKRNDFLLVLATHATISSRKYQELLISRGYNPFVALSTGLLVPLVEEGIWEGEILDAVFDHYFYDVGAPQGVILGCTHFPILERAFKARFPRAKIIHSGSAIVDWITRKMSFSDPNSGETLIRLIASDGPQRLLNTARTWVGENCFLEMDGSAVIK